MKSREIGRFAGGNEVFTKVEGREEWNETVAELGSSVLQSWEWGEFRGRQGWRPLRVRGEDWAAQVMFREAPLPGLGGFAYVPYGPAARDRDALRDAFQRLDEIAKDGGAFLLEVEPKTLENGSDLAVDGFVRGASSVQPRCTLVLDILDDEERQLAALPKDTRYGVRRAGREGIIAGPSEDAVRDLELFLDLLEETAGRQSFAVRPREYYREFMSTLPAHLIVARKEGEEQLLAGAVVLTFGEEAVYLYGASTREGENLYASYLTQFEALSASRREGATRYDMGGVPCEPREDHPLWGVYKFKKKFGGREERYLGTYEKRIRPVRATLAQAGIRGYYALQKARGRGSGPVSD